MDQVLDSKNDGGVGEVCLGKGESFLGIANKVVVFRGAVILLGKFDEGGGKVDAKILEVGFDEPTQHTLTAGEIKN